MQAQLLVDLRHMMRILHLQVAVTLLQSLSYTHDCRSMIIWLLAAQRVVATSPLRTAWNRMHSC